MQSLILVVLAAVLTVASIALRPQALPLDVGKYELDLAAAEALDGVLWIDARIDTDFSESHLGGAILLNEEDWEGGFARLLDSWVPGSPIVVYCSTQACLRSHHVAERLRAELGVEEIYTLHGGWEALLEAGMVEGGRR